MKHQINFFLFIRFDHTVRDTIKCNGILQIYIVPSELKKSFMSTEGK